MRTGIAVAAINTAGGGGAVMLLEIAIPKCLVRVSVTKQPLLGKTGSAQESPSNDALYRDHIRSDTTGVILLD